MISLQRIEHGDAALGRSLSTSRMVSSSSEYSISESDFETPMRSAKRRKPSAG
jgi:hypothetical protein